MKALHFRPCFFPGKQVIGGNIPFGSLPLDEDGPSLRSAIVSGEIIETLTEHRIFKKIKTAS